MNIQLKLQLIKKIKQQLYTNIKKIPILIINKIIFFFIFDFGRAFIQLDTYTNTKKKIIIMIIKIMNLWNVTQK